MQSVVWKSTWKKDIQMWKNPLKSNKKVDNEKNISEEKSEKELNIQMKPIPKKKRGEISL